MLSEDTIKKNGFEIFKAWKMHIIFTVLAVAENLICIQNLRKCGKSSHIGILISINIIKTKYLQLDAMCKTQEVITVTEFLNIAIFIGGTIA